MGDLDVDPLEGGLELAAVVWPHAAVEHVGVADTQKLAHEFHLDGKQKTWTGTIRT